MTSHTSLHQSPLFAQFTKNLGWQVILYDGINIFIRSLSFMGTLAKIQRPSHLPDPLALTQFLKKHKVTKIVAEARHEERPDTFSHWYTILSKNFSMDRSSYLPTKTIVVDISDSLDVIFARFTPAKKRAIKKAIKNGIYITESNSITDLISIKNKSAGLFGFITTYGMEKLWPVFSKEKKAAIVLARSNRNDQIIGGILLLFWGDTAYYWITGTTKYGKKLFAPALLVWEAIRISKENDAKQFDFVGVWDERLPKEYDSWKGFTKFKEGFGGKILYYPIP